MSGTAGALAAARPIPHAAAARPKTRGATISHAGSASGREDLTIWLLVAIPGLILAAAFAFVLGVYQGDALSRTYQAASVLFPGPPRLANLSFIWSPLPTLLQLPLVALRPLATNGFPAQIVSVAFAGGSLVMLNRLLRPLLPERRWRYGLLAIYQCNPMVLVYAINGMSETILIFWVLVGVYSFTEVWRHGEAIPARHLLFMGLAASMAFFTRYEGVVFGMALAAALVLYALPRQPSDADRAEAILLAYSAPWAYAIFLWLLWNWIIMGSPIYFLRGRGSNADEAAALLASNQQMASLYHNLPNALDYVVRLLGHLFPLVFPVMLLLVVRFIRRRDRYALALALITATFPAFQLVMHVFGQSFGYLRFHIYVIPLTFLGAAYLVSSVRRMRTAWRTVAAAGLLASSVATAFALDEPTLQRFTERAYADALMGRPAGANVAPDREMAGYLQALLRKEPRARILVDDLHGDALIVFSGAFDRFVSTRDVRFAEYAAHPAGWVDYVLASNEPGDLVAAGAAATGRLPSYLQQVRETSAGQARVWRLYRVGTSQTRSGEPSGTGTTALDAMGDLQTP